MTQKNRRILIADDSSAFLKLSIVVFIKQLAEYEIDIATTPREIREALSRYSYDVVILDVSFSPMKKEGLQLLEEIKAEFPETEVLMYTGFDDMETLTESMQLGADDFCSKHKQDVDVFIDKIKKAILKKSDRSKEYEAGKKIALENGAVFLSKAMMEVYALAAKARANPKRHVLITGPTGAGKDLAAKAISREKDGRPFIVVNCANFTKTLFESELFGHEKGSFTGADSVQIGKFEAAEGGDLYLDELGSLPLEIQAAFLVAAQTGHYSRVGSSKVRRANVRIIAATNNDLEARVRDGTFREDLLQRFKGIEIEIPPLSEHKEDIPIIVDFIIKKSDRPTVTVAPEAMDLFQNYDWPCNIRELDDIIKAMIMASNANVLTVGDIPRVFFNRIAIEAAKQNVSSNKELQLPEQFNKETLDESLRKHAIKILKVASKRVLPPVSLQKLAEEVGLSKSTLAHRLKRLEIDLESLKE